MMFCCKGSFIQMVMLSRDLVELAVLWPLLEHHGGGESAYWVAVG